MHISLLLVVPNNAQIAERDYDATLDDVRSILFDVCQKFDVQSRFVVSGFGQTTWPVAVDTDLPLLLEQLPESIAAVEKSMATNLDFYEQGLERTLSFVPIAPYYEVTCHSATSWQPAPFHETIGRLELLRILKVILFEFLRALETLSPQALGHPWIVEWLQPCNNSRP